MTTPAAQGDSTPQPPAPADTPTPPQNPPASPPAPPSPPFDPAAFMTEMDTKMSAWVERATQAVKEAIPAAPAPPATPPPPADEANNVTDDKGKGDKSPTPGKKRTFAEMWFG